MARGMDSMGDTLPALSAAVAGLERVRSDKPARCSTDTSRPVLSLYHSVSARELEWVILPSANSPLPLALPPGTNKHQLHHDCDPVISSRHMYLPLRRESSSGAIKIHDPIFGAALHEAH